MITDLAGRTAVVTGAGSGMGRAFARRFGRAGMNVVAADIQPDALAETVATMRDGGCSVLGVPTDVSAPHDIERLAGVAEATFGPVHLLVNNAGVEGYLDGPIWAATDRDWHWTVDVNFWSVVHGIRAFVPRMLAHGEPAHVVNTASMTAVIAAGNMYGITKHAVLALSEVLAKDLAEAGASIGVTAVCPGTIATNLFYGSRNRPQEMCNDDAPGVSDSGTELRERMHAALSAGMSPDVVAELVLRAVQSGAQYLLTDHEWDSFIVARHEAILDAAVDPAEATAAVATHESSSHDTN